MTIADILIWEATNGLLLIPLIIALVMLMRWIRGRPVFTDRDWLFLIGHPWEKVLSVHVGAKIRRALVRRGAHTFSCPLVSHPSLAPYFSPLL